MFKLPNETVWRQWAPLPLRLVIGYGFVAHGWAKLSQGPAQFAKLLDQIGAPLPLGHLSAYFSALGASAALGDIDGDGLPNDLCYIDPRIDQVVIAPAPGTPQDRYEPFVLQPGPLPYDSTMAPTGCLLGAFNEDGLTDVLVYFWGRSPIIYLQQPAAAGGERLTAQSFIPCELIEPWQRWFSCAATQADLDGDGHCDLVIGNYCADGGDYLDPNGTGQLTMTESLSRTRPGLPGLASRCRRVRFRGRSYRYGPWNADTVKDSDAPHSARWYAGMPPVPIEMDSIVLEELNREGPPWAER